ncbi:S66 family peptidase [Devosia nitrariae]|uniref:LD-carboxypeptidase n=1 Tax=Devosia nitrariae TaxID=2071872 RepID=A0ABQ5W131_9HYPH|nr:S66 peptidase family protein [Devosia nitrariae]GLQ53777.1 LD-carboxypeptidase [Devosia nitrariae]
MLSLTKPRRLRPGDRVAAVTPSWGGPGTFPHRYEAGKRQMEETFGVKVVEMPHTLAEAGYLAEHPQARAEDLLRAFADPEIAGIVATIGGDDCIRLLPHLDLGVIRDNPKVFIGFSDTTALHFACIAAGLTSFYGPSLMAGFGENGGMHRYTADGVRKALFTDEAIGLVPVNDEGWTVERLDWARPELQSQKRVLEAATPPLVLQGTGVARGHLLGGCAEVIEMVKGTAWWPPLEAWRGAILFYETSEEAPPPRFIRYWLRSFAAQGILQVLNGILIARPDPGGNARYQEELEATFIECLAEAGLSQLPVLSRLDFGHTQPMLTLPYGAKAEINCTSGELLIAESGVV